MSSPLNEPVFRLTPQSFLVILISFFVIIFFINLFFQYKAIISPPKLSVERPSEGEVLNSQTLEVKGKTDSDAVIEINKKSQLMKTGNFRQHSLYNRESIQLLLKPSANTARNKL